MILARNAPLRPRSRANRASSRRTHLDLDLDHDHASVANTFLGHLRQPPTDACALPTTTYSPRQSQGFLSRFVRLESGQPGTIQATASNCDEVTRRPPRPRRRLFDTRGYLSTVHPRRPTARSIPPTPPPIQASPPASQYRQGGLWKVSPPYVLE
ncbi:unnamed protein product [Cutaneotrichosporon oleaginosum]